MDCKKDKQVRHGYGDYKFENLVSLPENSFLIDKYKKTHFRTFIIILKIKNSMLNQKIKMAKSLLKEELIKLVEYI